MRSWKRKQPGLDLEAELRANRPEPSPELLSRLEARVRAKDGRYVRAGSFRLAFASAIATGVLTALASVGGLGYAANATGNAVEKAKRVVHSHGVAVVHKTAARDQYAPKKKVVKKKKAKKKAKKKGVRFGQPPFTG